MKRVGSRIQLAIRKWKRVQRQLELFRFRCRWAQKFGEYECVGGPFDGDYRPCASGSRYYTSGGFYEVDAGDARLHFHDYRLVTARRR